MACNGNCGGTLEFHLDSVSGPLAGSMPVPATGGWQTWKTVNAAAAARGVHDVYVLFKAGPRGTSALGNLKLVSVQLEFAIESTAVLLLSLPLLGR